MTVDLFGGFFGGAVGSGWLWGDMGPEDCYACFAGCFVIYLETIDQCKSLFGNETWQIGFLYQACIDQAERDYSSCNLACDCF